MHMKCIMPFPNHTCQYTNYACINKIYIHTTCYLIHINNINYISYNSNTHVNTFNFHALTYYFPYNSKPFISSNILLTTHMDHFRSNQENRDCLNEQWAVRGQPTHQASVPICGTEIHGHFQPNNTQTTIYCINYHTNHPNSP